MAWAYLAFSIGVVSFFFSCYLFLMQSVNSLKKVMARDGTDPVDFNCDSRNFKRLPLVSKDSMQSLGKTKASRESRK